MAADLFTFSLLIWAGFVFGIGIIIFGISRSQDVHESVWEQAAQAISWFVLFIGVHVGGRALPLHVAQGITRRQFAIGGLLFGAIYSIFIALLQTLGWVAERLIYSANDWPQTFEQGHLFTNAHQYPRIFLEALIMAVLWGFSGALISAAYYRYAGSGLLTIVPCLLLLGIVQTAIGTDWGPAVWIFRLVYSPDTASLPLTVVAAVACIAALLAMIWYVVRDLPLRAQAQ